MDAKSITTALSQQWSRVPRIPRLSTFQSQLVYLGCGCLLIAFFGFCLASGTPRIDASTEDTYRESLQRMKDDLSPTDQKRLVESLKVLAFSGLKLGDLAAGNKQQFLQNIMVRFDGKTAQEIIAEGEVILSQRKEEERQQALLEIQELEAKKGGASVAQESIKQFKVTRSEFKYTGEYTKRPTIFLTVTNGTEHAVSRVYFHGVLATPGRTIPWVEDDFNYSIPGGLEPGEDATWALSPNMFGSWGKAPEGRKDMVLTTSVVRLDGANGEAVYDARFDEDDQERLGALKAALND